MHSNQPPFDSPPQQPVATGPDTAEGRWTWKSWMVLVILPIIVAMITGGYFINKGGNTPAANSLTNPLPTPIPTPSIPTLHPSYTGGFTDSLRGGAPVSLIITNLNEDSTGAFTAQAQDGFCVAQVNGKVTADGSVTFQLQEAVNFNTGCGLILNFIGNLDNTGHITGNWISGNGGNGQLDIK